MRVAYYISAHGYGHGVRSCDVLRALLTGFPGVEAVITTDLPESFLHSRLAGLDGRFSVRSGALEVGMGQLDSIRVDVAATLDRVLALMDRWEALREAEASFLRDWGADVVVADIPAIPLEAAADAGVRRLAVGNFSWDWIYSPFAGRDARWEAAVRRFAQGYAAADTLLRLPFSPEMEVFERRIDIPLLASAGRTRREELAAMTGADPAARWVLLSFTTLEWGDEALRELETIGGTEFFTVLPLEWRGRPRLHAVDRGRMPFSDVLASVDVVVSKPGYGILSDCVANGKPLVYADRDDFIEYPLLVRELKRYIRNIHIPSYDLYAGRLGEALAAISQAPSPLERLAGGGARMAAERIAGETRG